MTLSIQDNSSTVALVIAHAFDKFLEGNYPNTIVIIMWTTSYVKMVDEGIIIARKMRPALYAYNYDD